MQIHSNRYLLVIIIDNKRNIAICRCDFKYKDLIKSCGFQWDNVSKNWHIDLNYFKKNEDFFHSRLGLCSTLLRELNFGVKYKQPMPEKSPRLDFALSTLKINPYAYQIDGINYGLQNPYCIIGDEMGLGKTPQGIGILSAFQAPSLVICPASLKYNWQAELDKFSSLNAIVIDDSKTITKKKNQWTMDLIEGNWPIVFIINYEIIKNYEFLFERCKHWVIDEAHALKNPDANRTKIFGKYLKLYKPQTCTFLSGTAITNNVSDFFSLLNFCSWSSRANGLRISDNPRWSSHFRFSEYFCHKKNTKFGTKYCGLKNWPELRELMAHKYLRRSTSDHLPDLPSLTRSIFTCNPEKHELSALDNGLSIAFQMIRNGAKFGPKDDICISTAKKGAAMLKTQFSAEIGYSLISEGEKVLIFSDHIDVCHAIKEHLGETAFAITSDVNQKFRQEICERFQDLNNQGCQAIVATYGTMNAGRTLTAARVTICNDLPWIPSTYLQAEKRFHRIGQTKHCIVKIVSAPGLDSMINKTILDKALVLTQVLSFGQEKTLEFN